MVLSSLFLAFCYPHTNPATIKLLKTARDNCLSLQWYHHDRLTDWPTDQPTATTTNRYHDRPDPLTMRSLTITFDVGLLAVNSKGVRSHGRYLVQRGPSFFQPPTPAPDSVSPSITSTSVSQPSFWRVRAPSTILHILLYLTFCIFLTCRCSYTAFSKMWVSADIFPC